MSTATLVSVDEYLRTSYPDGDREYVDGRIVELAMPDLFHSETQTSMAVCLRINCGQFWVGIAPRTRVRPGRFRLPDLAVVPGPRPDGKILTTPPFLVVEIVSPDDRIGELDQKIDEYLAFGVSYIWVVNPHTRRAYIHSSEGVREAKDGFLRTANPEIAVPLADVLPR